MTAQSDRRVPMGSAPMKYTDGGSVDWGNMWDSFCELAQSGGPPHRDSMLEPDERSDQTSPEYQAVLAEIIRGVQLVSGLAAAPAKAGWIAIRCPEPGMARWLADAIIEENVQSRTDGATLLVPAGQHYTLKGEIKNVITAVAKTTHYWGEHLPSEVRSALAVQEQLGRITRSIGRLFGRG
jgi:sirohydrochlorin cobaltochelatase